MGNFLDQQKRAWQTTLYWVGIAHPEFMESCQETNELVLPGQPGASCPKLRKTLVEIVETHMQHILHERDSFERSGYDGRVFDCDTISPVSVIEAPWGPTLETSHIAERHNPDCVCLMYF